MTNFAGKLPAVVMTACKKTPIPELSEGNDPIYTLKGQVDGEGIDYNVGLETVVMNKGVIEEDGLISYYGEMESANDNEKIRLVRQVKSIFFKFFIIKNILKMFFLRKKSFNFQFIMNPEVSNVRLLCERSGLKSNSEACLYRQTV